jgi:hypothetical protein
MKAKELFIEVRDEYGELYTVLMMKCPSNPYPSENLRIMVRWYLWLPLLLWITFIAKVERKK